MDFNTFKKYARKGNLIAVSESVPADLETPVTSFLKLSQDLPHAFLLESAEQEERIGRYSFIGLRPKAVLTSFNNSVQILKGHQKKPRKIAGHIVDVIEKMISTYKLANPETLPGFSGGFVGYLGYENVQYFEDIQLTRKKGVPIPDAVFFLCEELVIFDHFRKTLCLAVLIEIDRQSNLRQCYQTALHKIARLRNQLNEPIRLPKRKKKRAAIQVHSNMSQKNFEKNVSRIKEYIRAGDCIQVVFSQRFMIPKVKHNFQIYRALRSINPSPYMFYFRSRPYCLIGSSPELLVRKKGRNAEVRPIAGTRPRGKTIPEDLANEENLKKSPKEMAEHIMLVDLGRNDLGRVCEFKSIRVQNFAHVDRYSHVMHLESEVVGKLKSKKNMFDLLKATFPAGTVSGAPKIRAMQIIDELETERRGPYAGCLGYFGFDQNMDMCITLRTLVSDGNKIYVQAGAGIVKDSNPKREYIESINKAKAILKAIEMRELF